MQVWPAIDLRGGKCVRLQQGDYNRETVFGDDPAAMAQRWVDQGATHLHLVDLDGARDGRLVNYVAITRIMASVRVTCELGGGIRDEQTIARLLDLGLDRLVVGTRALQEPEWFREVSGKYSGKLVLGIDARDGRVATDGWLNQSTTLAAELAQQFEAAPLAAIVYTDIAMDGMLAGPNLSAMAGMRRATSLPVVASGGITSANDIKQLAALGMAGCIVGRALYEDRLTLADAIAAAAA
jgi:phosphoribosylformimino-5-aminoimidazole carboxamide ribotide isomerase